MNQDPISENKNRPSQPNQEKLKMLGALISGITHEINTPMHYLDTNLTFLKYAFKDLLDLIKVHKRLLNLAENGVQVCSEDWQQLHQAESDADPDYLLKEIGLALEQSEEGIAMVSRLVLAMKDFSHPSPHTFSLVDVNKCIDTVYTISRFEWKRVADFELHLSRDLPYLFASRDELHQVLLNIIVNAAHAIGEKIAARGYDRGKISVFTRTANDCIEIEIRNDGPVISNESMKQIFEPYFTTKDPGKGTGLGLNLVKHIVEQEHGGQIKVTSDPENGTAFLIVLPHRQNSADL